MKINKKKFIKRITFLIIFTGITAYGIYLWETPLERERLISLYYSVVAKMNKTEIKDVEKVFNIQYDSAVQTTILGRKDGILLIDKTGIKEYTNSNNPVWIKDIAFTNPIVAEEDGKTVIAESNGKKVVTFDMRQQMWTSEVEGNIQKILINKMGYVGVIFTETGYKSGFTLFNNMGEEIYTKLFANTIIIDADISEDGKTVAMIEGDSTGTVMDSLVSYLSETGELVSGCLEKNVLLTGIKFFQKDTLIVGDSEIIKINKNREKTVIDDFSNIKVSGVNIESDRIIKVFRDSASIFADKATIEVLDINGKQRGLGEVSGNIKAVESEGRTIAIVLNDRVDFFDISGKYLNTIFITGDYKNMKLFSNGSYACIQTVDQITVVKVR